MRKPITRLREYANVATTQRPRLVTWRRLPPLKWIPVTDSPKLRTSVHSEILPTMPDEENIDGFTVALIPTTTVKPSIFFFHKTMTVVELVVCSILLTVGTAMICICSGLLYYRCKYMRYKYRLKRVRKQNQYRRQDKPLPTPIEMSGIVAADETIPTSLVNENYYEYPIDAGLVESHITGLKEMVPVAHSGNFVISMNRDSFSRSKPLPKHRSRTVPRSLRRPNAQPPSVPLNSVYKPTVY